MSKVCAAWSSIFRIQAPQHSSARHATAPTSAPAVCIRIFAPGSDVCEAHFSLIPFPESLIDAVVNTPAAARRSGLSYAIPHRAPPLVPRTCPVSRPQSITRSYFLYLLASSSSHIHFLFLCCPLPSPSTEQCLSVLHSFIANPQDPYPLPAVSSIHHTAWPWADPTQPDLTWWIKVVVPYNQH